MDEKRKKRLDLLQNLSIALLSLSAVILFIQTQFINLDNSENDRFLSWLTSSDSTGESAATAETTPLSAPVRVAVSDAYARYGSISATTADEDFSPLGTLLGEVLGSAETYTPCSESVWLQALESTSIYYDFLAPLPLSLVSAYVGAEVDSSLQARTLILSEQGTGDVTLYLWNGSASYYTAPTAASHNDLTETVRRYELGNADFAFDLAEDPAYAAVEDWTLLLRTLPEFPILNASVPSQAADRLLLALNFNPSTKSRYTESNGTEVIVENDRSLHIQPNGSVLYLGSETDPLTVLEGTSFSSPTEIALAGNSFINELLTSLSSNVSLYLLELQQVNDETILRFGYHMNGVPIRFADGSYAAELTLSGTSVISLEMHARQYESGSTASSLLPLTQALAIAGQQRGAELSIAYIDKAGSTVQAGWLAD